MGYEEIEDFYDRESENIDKKFLDQLKTPKTDLNNLESWFKAEQKKLREEYHQKYLDYIQEQKKRPPIKNKKIENKKKEPSTFKVVPLDLNLTRKERLSIRWQLFKFKSRIKIRNFKSKITPSFYVIMKIRTRIFFRNLIHRIINFISKTISKTKELIVLSYKGTKKLLKNIFIKIKNIVMKILTKILNIFRKKKKEGEEGKEEKTEDQKIAEKLMKKSS